MTGWMSWVAVACFLAAHAGGTAAAQERVTRLTVSGARNGQAFFSSDADALLSGVRAVLVGNAPSVLRSEVRASAESRGLHDRVYFASSHFAAGVVEGLHHFASGAAT